MISLDKCKTTLNKKGKDRFTDEEILKIRDFLYTMARVVINNQQIEHDRKK